MKILLLDIETAPNSAYVWGLWQQNVALNQIIDTGHVLCWAAKWYGDKEIQFSSTYETSPKRMLSKIHKLLDEADVVVHYNGKRFDIPILNREFLLKGFKPTSPYKQVDLLTVARNRFRFVSNKLDFVAKALGLGSKTRHKGFELWIECMNNDPEAWKQMETYNRQDVNLLEKVYDVFKPWVTNHPNFGTYSNSLVCPSCGGNHYQRRGVAVSKSLSYTRYQCTDCGKWFRSSKSDTPRGTDKFVEV